jgi:hypothetical protein
MASNRLRATCFNHCQRMLLVLHKIPYNKHVMKSLFIVIPERYCSEYPNIKLSRYPSFKDTKELFMLQKLGKNAPLGINYKSQQGVPFIHFIFLWLVCALWMYKKNLGFITYYSPSVVACFSHLRLMHF